MPDKQIKMPDEMKIEERNGCTLDMYNDRGSSRLLDIFIDRQESLSLHLDLNAVNGQLDIKSGEQYLSLSAYQVEALVRFLQQRD